jgi:hypothetical protein
VRGSDHRSVDGFRGDYHPAGDRPAGDRNDRARMIAGGGPDRVSGDGVRAAGRVRGSVSSKGRPARMPSHPAPVPVHEPHGLLRREYRNVSTGPGEDLTEQLWLN